MAMSKKSEKALLDHDEWVLVESTHLPALGQLDAEALADARKRLRTMRDKERTQGYEKRRVARGKAEERGGSSPGTYARPKQRKQVFSHALRRLNDEATRRKGRASRARIVESQQRALAAKRAAPSNRPANTATAAAGGVAIENKKARTKVSGAKVGSVSQGGKRAQAKKDG